MIPLFIPEECVFSYTACVDKLENDMLIWKGPRRPSILGMANGLHLECQPWLDKRCPGSFTEKGSEAHPRSGRHPGYALRGCHGPGPGPRVAAPSLGTATPMELKPPILRMGNPPRV